MAKTSIKKKRPSDGRTLRQYAALPYMRNEAGEVEVLIMSSRETRRAVIPKGWPMRSLKGWKAAEIEAREEAGLVGQISSRSVGQYLYWKRLPSSFVLVKVVVYPLRVTRQLADWPEKHERDRQWVNPQDAATLIDETDLGELIVAFARSLDAKPKAVAKRADGMADGGTSQDGGKSRPKGSADEKPRSKPGRGQNASARSSA